MRILISLSTPQLIQDPYTGTKGLYSAVTLDSTGTSYVAGIAKALGLDIPADKLHCTVMYSPEKCPKTAECDAAKTYSATVNKIDHWAGHDEKGYLTLQLSSPGLAAEHARLKKLGCESTYEEYKPHVTLYEGIQMTDELRSKIDDVSRTMTPWDPLTFSNQFIGDMKD